LTPVGVGAFPLGPVAIAVMPPSNQVSPRRPELAATPTIGSSLASAGLVRR